ncbi:MAG: hypothetical protein KDK35_20730 [Leptospiraceae bacterium]|nr:hypothetical protein [Leptospiraceae bacterium]
MARPHLHWSVFAFGLTALIAIGHLRAEEPDEDCPSPHSILIGGRAGSESAVEFCLLDPISDEVDCYRLDLENRNLERITDSFRSPAMENHLLVHPRRLTNAARRLAVTIRPDPDNEARMRFRTELNGRLLAEFTRDFQDRDASFVELLGETLFLRDCVGAGPGCNGLLLDARDGRLIADFQDLSLNMYGAGVAHQAGNVWAFVPGDAGVILWINVRTGATVARLNIPMIEPDSGLEVISLNARTFAIVLGGAHRGTTLYVQHDPVELLATFDFVCGE